MQKLLDLLIELSGESNLIYRTDVLWNVSLFIIARAK